MSAPNARVQNGGLWNSTRPQVSAQTQNLLKTMMQEAKLTNFQQRALTNNMRSGNSLPSNLGATSVIAEKKKPPARVQERKIVNLKTYQGGIKNYEDIKNSGAYEKSDYRPAYKKPLTDQDKERLAKIMAYGKDIDKWPVERKEIEVPDYEVEEVEVDRFDELQSEIKERADFLAEMTRLGKRKEYHAIIMTEISQKIREMELIDKTRRKELDDMKRIRGQIS